MRTTMEQAVARKRAERAPRKLPKQERSRKTVEAILEAAGREFVRKGYNAATTNAIAEVAGVSIGSLYEYFPSKASILKALVDAQLELSVADLRIRLAVAKDQDFEKIAAAIARSAVDVYRQDTKLSRILLAGAPRVENWRRIDEVASLRAGLILDALTPLLPQTPALRHAAFTADCIAQSIAHRAILFCAVTEGFDPQAEIVAALEPYLRSTFDRARRATT